MRCKMCFREIDTSKEKGPINMQCGCLQGYPCTTHYHVIGRLASVMRSKLNKLEHDWKHSDYLADRVREFLYRAGELTKSIYNEADKGKTHVNMEDEGVMGFLEKVKQTPFGVQDMMRDNGIVIDDHDDPMQKFAFTLYTYLAALSSEAEQLLEEEDDV